MANGGNWLCHGRFEIDTRGSHVVGGQGEDEVRQRKNHAVKPVVWEATIDAVGPSAMVAQWTIIQH